ncbi:MULTISPECIES: hypothetical protein [Shouchella]|uniref:hypothetical protein n=1 Tax=Shouchella TaxID=2893057 RepID=UPI0009130DE4|nr:MULTISPECIES: hypothetical protein [Shouchella]MDO7285867.1 hypothetical protein [Shouchella clausii]MDO7305771.1 hypothetical protein [Shouchella clausii]SHM05139.1 hypothetical protein SAMN05192535_0108 [Shouchella rhizosphaerae]
MNKKFITTLGSIILISTLVACNDSEETVYQMNDDSDEYIPGSLEEIIQDTEVIVKGKFTEFIKTENLIRTADDPTQPADELYAEGHFYDFEVTESLKGDVSDTILTAIGVSDTIPILSDNGEDLGEVVVEMIDYEEIDMDKEYVLLLQDSSYIEEGLYTGAWSAHVIEIEEDGSVEFNTKRMQGQLDSDLEVETEGDVTFINRVTEHRDDISVDVHQEYQVFDDYLGNADIDSISDLEEFISNN